MVILLTAPQHIKQINSGIPASYVTTRQVLVGDSSIANKNKIGENHTAWSICRLQQPIPPTFSLFFQFPSSHGKNGFCQGLDKIHRRANTSWSSVVTKLTQYAIWVKSLLGKSSLIVAIMALYLVAQNIAILIHDKRIHANFIL